MPHIHVLTVSDRAHAGQAEDTAGPRALELIAQDLPDWQNSSTVAADGESPVREAVLAARDAGADVVLTLGGTGASPRDRTPEAMDGLLDRELPGVAEMLRRQGAVQTPLAAVGRGRAGIIDRPAEDSARSAGSQVPAGSTDPTSAQPSNRPTVVVNLPGALRAAEQSIPLITPLLPHLLDQLAGGDHARH